MPLGELLRELHRHHRQVRDLREAIDRFPQQLKVQQARATRQGDLLKQGQEALKKLKVKVLEKESTLKDKLQQVAKYERQLNESTSKKEYDALKAEIAHTKEQCSVLEDEILQAMTEIEERTAALPGLEKLSAAARDELARFDAHAKEQQAALGEQLAQAQAQLREVEGRLPEEHRANYERLARSMGADVLSPVRNRTCVACATEITAQDRNQLTMDRLVLCKSCGRLLYMPESETPQ